MARLLPELKFPGAAKSKALLAGPTSKPENNPSPRKSAGELFCRRKPVASNELRSAAAGEEEVPKGLTEAILVVAAEEEFSVRSCVKHWFGFNGSSSSSSSRASSHVAGADRNRESPVRLTPPPPPLLPPGARCICFRIRRFQSVSSRFWVFFFFSCLFFLLRLLKLRESNKNQMFLFFFSFFVFGLRFPCTEYAFGEVI